MNFVKHTNKALFYIIDFYWGKMKVKLRMSYKLKSKKSERIFVEHAIGDIKRYRVLFNQLKTHTTDLYDLILGVCADLDNYLLD